MEFYRGIGFGEKPSHVVVPMYKITKCPVFKVYG
jgi:hypothetical protein